MPAEQFLSSLQLAPPRILDSSNCMGLKVILAVQLQQVEREEQTFLSPESTSAKPLRYVLLMLST
jgi:hypothetical protein